MSSYDEHLISQAGGDGDDKTCPSECAETNHPGAEHDDVADRVARIQKTNEMWLQSSASDRTDHDMKFLLALVREQAAKIERVLASKPIDGTSGEAAKYAAGFNAALDAVREMLATTEEP